MQTSSYNSTPAWRVPMEHRFWIVWGPMLRSLGMARCIMGRIPHTMRAIPPIEVKLGGRRWHTLKRPLRARSRPQGVSLIASWLYHRKLLDHKLSKVCGKLLIKITGHFQRLYHWSIFEVSCENAWLDTLYRPQYLLGYYLPNAWLPGAFTLFATFGRTLL